jgi:hypothetical protein
VQRDDVNDKLKVLAFEFFFEFSRFEYALKENGYLKAHAAGARAEAGWDEYIQRFADVFHASAEAAALLAAAPEQQIVEAGDKLIWRPTALTHCTSDLQRVVTLLKTVRNNLFHGGKHGGAGWDNAPRTETLLANGRQLLAQLSILGGFESDFRGTY